MTVRKTFRFFPAWSARFLYPFRLIRNKENRINPEENFLKPEDIADLLVIGSNDATIRLGEVVNAIVLAEGVIIGVQLGKSREEAAVETVRLNQCPLLGATVIAVLAFAAIGFASGNAGEVCQSLFWVMAASLLLSWIFAVTVTPLLCVDFLKIPQIGGTDPYDRPMYRVYRRFLERVLHWRRTAFLFVVVMLVVSTWAFTAGLHAGGNNGSRNAPAHVGRVLQFHGRDRCRWTHRSDCFDVDYYSDFLLLLLPD